MVSVILLCPAVLGCRLVRGINSSMAPQGRTSSVRYTLRNEVQPPMETLLILRKEHRKRMVTESEDVECCQNQKHFD